MARSFEQVLHEVNKTSDPQKNTVLKQIADLPRQMKAEEAGLKATQNQAFDEILAGSRRRGLGFSGIPLGEQAQYTATQFLPAVARLRTSVNDRRTSLEGVLNDIGRQNYLTAQDIFARDRAFEEDRRRFELQQAEARRASAASATPAWLQALLGGQQQGEVVDDEEAAYQAYLRQQQAREERAVQQLRNNKGLKVLSSGSGLSVRGGGSIPTGQFTGAKRLPGF